MIYTGTGTFLNFLWLSLNTVNINNWSKLYSFEQEHLLTDAVSRNTSSLLTTNKLNELLWE